MTDNERLAVAEAEIEALKGGQKEMLQCMHELKDEMTRYKGFIGGVAFLTSCLAVAAGIFREWISKHL